MDNVVNVGLSRQMVLRRELDVIANNVANVDTAGFKLESLIVQTQTEQLPAAAGGAPSTVNFVLDAGVARDFAQGALRQTDSSFDFAIEGEGFFRVETPAGERYTRDGRFSLDAEGKLVTAAGRAVQGEGGEIVIDQRLGAPKVAADGTVSQGGQVVGKLAVVKFASLADLAKDGDGLYRNVSNAAPQAAADARIQQGMLEGSNVQPINQITRLIEVTRAYESIAKLIDRTQDLEGNAIQRLGKIN